MTACLSLRSGLRRLDPLRNGLTSGCYPLDKYYTAKPAAQKLSEIKKKVLTAGDLFF